ncbi:MAG: hypothetical protein WAL59_26645, partial [Roseiarcus sp.]
MPRKPAAATRPPAKKPVARTLKAKLLPPVVTLKHLAAEIAEAHEVPKTRAETMLADTVVRLARHLVMASTRATEGKMSGNDKFLARIEEILALCGSISSILETKIDDDLHAELAEIDENLMRAELSQAQETAAITRRKAIYEELHPGARQHVAGAIASNKSQGNASADSSLAFSEATSKATGKSRRSVEIAAALAADTARRVAREARRAPSSTTWPRKPPRTRPRALAAARADLVRSEIAFASCSAESIVGLEDGSFAHQCGTTGMFSLAASKCCIAAGQNWP